jgi:glycosyltransferase involved in cell wall biosynthesis
MFRPTWRDLCEPPGALMAGQLRIAIDARAAAEEPAGRGRYVRELLRELERDSRGHAIRAYARTGWDADVDWRLIEGRDPLWHLRAARAVSRECDVLLSTNSYLTSWFTSIPTVVVVHDMVPWMPEMHPQKRAALIERATIRPALRRAAAALCVSQSTEHDLVERFPAARGKTAVVHHGIGTEFDRTPELEPTRARLDLPERFILATGTVEPRKNLPRLIEAHAALADAPPLLVAGPSGWEVEQALAGMNDNVRLLGFVSDDDLIALYHLCTVFAYPSLYEGFGLPLAEAMRCGAACLTSDVSSLPEVGGDAVVYSDPRDIGSVRSGLERLLGSPDLRVSLGAKARVQSAQFTWARTIDQTLEVIERAARTPRQSGSPSPSR